MNHHKISTIAEKTKMFKNLLLQLHKESESTEHQLVEFTMYKFHKNIC